MSAGATSGPPGGMQGHVSGVSVFIVCGCVPVLELTKEKAIFFHENASGMLQAALDDYSSADNLFEHITHPDIQSACCQAGCPTLWQMAGGIRRANFIVRGVGLSGKRSLLFSLVVSLAYNVATANDLILEYIADMGEGPEVAAEFTAIIEIVRSKATMPPQSSSALDGPARAPAPAGKRAPDPFARASPLGKGAPVGAAPLSQSKGHSPHGKGAPALAPPSPPGKGDQLAPSSPYGKGAPAFAAPQPPGKGVPAPPPSVTWVAEPNAPPQGKGSPAPAPAAPSSEWTDCGWQNWKDNGWQDRGSDWTWRERAQDDRWSSGAGSWQSAPVQTPAPSITPSSPPRPAAHGDHSWSNGKGSSWADVPAPAYREPVEAFRQDPALLETFRERATQPLDDRWSDGKASPWETPPPYRSAPSTYHSPDVSAGPSWNGASNGGPPQQAADPWAAPMSYPLHAQPQAGSAQGSRNPMEPGSRYGSTAAPAGYAPFPGIRFVPPEDGSICAPVPSFRKY